MIEFAVVLLAVSVIVLCLVIIQLDKRINKVEEELQELKELVAQGYWQ